VQKPIPFSREVKKRGVSPLFKTLPLPSSKGRGTKGEEFIK
jgi:hypothetical protein